MSSGAWCFRVNANLNAISQDFEIFSFILQLCNIPQAHSGVNIVHNNYMLAGICYGVSTS